MNAFTSLVTLLLTSAIAVAQSTAPLNRSATAPNRQQELYDQYYGINRKTPSKTSTTVQTTSTTSNVASVSKTSAPKPAPSPIAETAAAPAPVGQSTTTRTAVMNRTTTPETGMAYDGPGTRIGIRGGVTYPIYLEKNDFAKPVVGFVGGIAFTFGSGTVAFQPEVNYSRYAEKTSYTFGTVTVSTNTTVDVLEVPLLLRFQSGSYAGNRFFFNVGPYGQYVLSAAADGKKIALTSNDKSRYVYGAAAGLGVALKAGPGHVIIEARGLYSLGDLQNGFSTNSKTILAQGTIGYAFGLGGRR